MEFINKTGLAYLWTKIKALVSAGQSSYSVFNKTLSASPTIQLQTGSVDVDGVVYVESTGRFIGYTTDSSGNVYYYAIFNSTGLSLKVSDSSNSGSLPVEGEYYKDVSTDNLYIGTSSGLTLVANNVAATAAVEAKVDILTTENDLMRDAIGRCLKGQSGYLLLAKAGSTVLGKKALPDRDTWLRIDSDTILKGDAGAASVLEVAYFDGTALKANQFDTCKNATRIYVGDWEDSIPAASLYAAFAFCAALEKLDVSNWDTSQVTTLEQTFAECYSLKELDVSAWDISSATSLYRMFYGCKNIKELDVSAWDTSKVTNMFYTFCGCSSLTSLDVSAWDVSNVKDFGRAFYNCSSLTSLDVSAWDISSATSLYAMFYGCKNIKELDVSKWDTSKVTNMIYTFCDCSSLTSLDLSNWDTSSVTEISPFISGCSKLRYITLGEKFFATTVGLPFGGAVNLGLNADGTDNGWLAHLAATAPTITDGNTRRIGLPKALQTIEGYEDQVAILTEKGYTVIFY